MTKMNVDFVDLYYNRADAKEVKERLELSSVKSTTLMRVILLSGFVGLVFGNVLLGFILYVTLTVLFDILLDLRNVKSKVDNDL